MSGVIHIHSAHGVTLWDQPHFLTVVMTIIFFPTFIHKTLLRYLLLVQNDHSRISARNQVENTRMLPPTCSLIVPLCLKRSQLLIFSSSVIRDVRTERKWTITWCVAAYGASLLSAVTRKPSFILAYSNRFLFSLYEHAYDGTHTRPPNIHSGLYNE